ncbi:ferredoxin reductase [Streptomyces sp. CA-132043]|uniref:ferredoxin reductase n=1 Tax=Streptomyces sp. CA-132043 TaxID=3240048 RepID=UPI003D927A98
MTTPLSPGDYAGLIDPLLSARPLSGRVVAVRPEHADAATLTIRPGRGWTGHRAGQYLPVGVELDGQWVWRTYSLTSPPHRPGRPGRPDGTVTVTVQAVPDGRVSPHLVRHTPPGTLLRLGPAQGDFTFPDPPPTRVLMLTAGSGITPVIGLLRTLMDRTLMDAGNHAAAHGHCYPCGPGTEDGCPAPGPGSVPGPVPGTDVVLVHSAPTSERSLFRDELRSAQRKFPWFRLHEHHTRSPRAGSGGRPAARLTPAQLTAVCPDWRERETFACGPAGMLDAVEEHWAQARLSARLHVERFRPPAPFSARLCGDDDGGSGDTAPVYFSRSGVEVVTARTEPLLDVGEAAGVAMPYGCRRGICFGCLAPLSHGRVRDLRTGEVRQAHAGGGMQLIQTCVSAAAGPLALAL